LTNTQGNFGNHDRKEVLAHYQADLKLPEKEEKGQHRDVLHLHELAYFRGQALEELQVLFHCIQ
jgi:hypothetical protein